MVRFFGLVHNAVLLSAPDHIYDVMFSRRAFCRSAWASVC